MSRLSSTQVTGVVLYSRLVRRSFSEGGFAVRGSRFGDHRAKEIMRETPIPDSYWLIEGELLAGVYPGAYDDDRARQKLEAILGAGIRSFIDLTETVDLLTPYEPMLRELAANMNIDVSYRRLPIRDMSIPTTEGMAEILSTIEMEIGAGRPVYVHCWGGIGRTGTVAGCWLVEQGHTCDAALERIRELRARTPDRSVESPQTEDQRAFIRSWAKRNE